jgi:hypothetical protein
MVEMNKDDSFKEWPFFIKGKTDIIFVHIPKTAGTSIRYSLGFNNMDKAKKIRDHYTVKEIIDLIGKEKWNNAFKFTFVRNPWDRLCSFYSFRLKKGKIKDISHKKSFKQWALYELGERDPSSKKRFNLIPQTNWLVDNQNNIQLNFIGRFENLNQDFQRLGKLISFNTILPHLNISNRENDYRLQYDDELIQCNLPQKRDS